MVGLGTVPQGISLKCTAERFAELVEQEGIRPAPYVGRYKWVLVERLDILPIDELEGLIRQSYELVTAKLPKKRTKKALGSRLWKARKKG